jgi:hypothetical protein
MQACVFPLPLVPENTNTPGNWGSCSWVGKSNALEVDFDLVRFPPRSVIFPRCQSASASRCHAHQEPSMDFETENASHCTSKFTMRNMSTINSTTIILHTTIWSQSKLNIIGTGDAVIDSSYVKLYLCRLAILFVQLHLLDPSSSTDEPWGRRN